MKQGAAKAAKQAAQAAEAARAELPTAQQGAAPQAGPLSRQDSAAGSSARAGRRSGKQAGVAEREPLAFLIEPKLDGVWVGG